MNTRFVQRTYDKAAAERLMHAGVLRPIAQALSARGITQSDDLCEDWQALISPTQLEGTQEAAKILADCAEDGRHVVVVADYDCDGATACAAALRGFAMMGVHATYVVPDRFTTGYGLSPQIVDLALEKDPQTKLIVTVDNGIASVEGVAAAKAKGIDVIITDHHLAGEELPQAACIVNPNLPTSHFPSKALAGCGVMFYVLLALRAELRRRGKFTNADQPRLGQLADVVALGTVADVVKLDQNNRILIAQGLARIRQGVASPGINALFAAAGRDIGHACAGDFAFAIAPRINAAGRLTEMGVGIECLLTQDPDQAQKLAGELEELNRKRRDLEDSMQLDASSIVHNMDLSGRATLTLFDEPWHQGVVGLVASRVKERVNRPVIAFARDGDEELKGSGRSIPGIHLRDALDRVSKMDPNLIERFGGHAMAAGLTIRRENLDRFAELFEKAVREAAAPGIFDKVILTDGALAPEEIGFSLVEAINERIWGQGFEKPLFANDFTILTQRVLKGTHLKMLLDLAGSRFEAIFFRQNQPLGRHVRLAYRPEINEFMGRRSVQLVVEAAEEIGAA